VTTPRRPDEELERLLAEDGGELGALYRRLPRVEPPRRLDRSVLGEAARAVHGTRPRRQRWLVGLGSAAGLVLAAGIAWHVGHEPLRQPSQAPAHGTPSYVPVQPIDAPARRREAAPTFELAPPAPAPAASAPPKPASADEAKAARAARPTAEHAPAAQRSATPPAAPPPMTAPEPPAPAALAVPSIQASPQEAAAQTGAKATSADSASESEALSKPATDAAPKKRERSAGAPAPSSSAELRRDTQLAPELWLARIEQLLRQGRRQQAVESLQLFRRAHPDWQLPEELRALDR
jgi:hypothetical protein